MTAVFTILVLLIAVTPVLTITGGVVAEGLLLATTAIAVALLVLTATAGELRRLGTLLAPVAPIALIPCVWMLLQIAPVPAMLAHPAWASAAAALDKPLHGTISLDTGATLLSLSRYWLALATMVVAAAVALDRQRAETILFLSTAAAVSIAAGLIGFDLGALRFAEIDPAAQRGQMLTIAVIGLVLSCATGIRFYESHRMVRAAHGKPDASPIMAAVASTVAVVICLYAVAIDPALLPAAACGVLALIGLVVIRRSRLGVWGQSGIAAAAVVVVIALFAASPANRAVDLTLSLSGQSQVALAAAERMLSDAAWTGTGAGTFEALLPIYHDVDAAAETTAPTAAAAVAITMGRPFLWILVVVTLLGAWSLFRRAVKRGREYAYAGAGAACIVAILIASFANAGIFGLAALLLASVVCGLALGQSRSWSAELQPSVGQGLR